MSVMQDDTLFICHISIFAYWLLVPEVLLVHMVLIDSSAWFCCFFGSAGSGGSFW